MEYLKNETVQGAVRAVLFDFDGTISTLRCGWEKVMRPLMLEMISGGKEYDEALEKEVDDYISESTGIQTIHQMKWLADRVKAEGNNPGVSEDPWWYKAEYNRRLMANVQNRLDALLQGNSPKENYLVGGSEGFLKALQARGVKVYVASGTDHPDVVNEATALGMAKYFTQIAGAPVGSENCSKEKVIAQLMEDAELFTKLDQITINEKFTIYVFGRELTYQIDEIKVVSPEAMGDLSIVENEDYVTLVTCTPYGINSHRLLVRGSRI